MSNSKFVTHDGKTLSINQWAAELGIDRKTFLYRLEHCPNKAFHKGRLQRGANRKPLLYEHGGRTLTARQWATELGITKSAFKSRLRVHPTKAFTPGNLPNQVPHTKLYAHGGRTLTAAQWSAELGITKDTFQQRHRNNPETAFKVGRLHRVHFANRYEYGGKQLTIREIASLTGYSESTIRKHLKSGKAAQEKPAPESPASMRELHRPYFTFSNGGSLKTPHHATTHPHHHHTGGSSKTFNDHSPCRPPPRESDLQHKNATKA